MNKKKLLLIIPVLLVVTAVYVFAMYFKNKDKTLTNDDTTEFTVNDNNTRLPSKYYESSDVLIF